MLVELSHTQEAAHEKGVVGCTKGRVATECEIEGLIIGTEESAARAVSRHRGQGEAVKCGKRCSDGSEH